MKRTPLSTRTAQEKAVKRAEREYVLTGANVEPVIPGRTPINPRSKKGARTARQDAATKKLVFESAGGVCARCGKPANDDSHSRGKKANPELRYVLLNHELFCRECHDWWGVSPVARYDWLMTFRPEAAKFLNAAAWRDLNASKTRPVQDLRRAA